jgi:hypothetical protein
MSQRSDHDGDLLLSLRKGNYLPFGEAAAAQVGFFEVSSKTAAIIKMPSNAHGSGLSLFFYFWATSHIWR